MHRKLGWLSVERRQGTHHRSVHAKTSASKEWPGGCGYHLGQQSARFRQHGSPRPLDALVRLRQAIVLVQFTTLLYRSDSGFISLERPIMRFASLRLVSQDVSALAAFYERVTGATPTGFADFMELKLDRVTLAICSERSVSKDNAAAAVAGQNRSAIIEFEVEDVDAERARLADVVTQWVLEPTDQPWGNRSTLLRDPDGNLINLFTPLPTRSV